MSVETIIWDWNGTLLNDVDICIAGINGLLEKRSIPVLSREKYMQIFTFPVKDYYQLAGLDFSKDSFDVLADEFITEYYRTLSQAELFSDVKETLAFFKSKNIRQVIISAMEHNSLVISLKHFGIAHFFDTIQGIEDHLANGKLHNYIAFFEKYTDSKANSCIIGDTLHDLEIGVELGVQTWLVARGHHSFERLLSKTENVCHDFTELKSKICIAGL